jgi:malonyl-CoA O-methyltransferase
MSVRAGAQPSGRRSPAPRSPASSPATTNASPRAPATEVEGGLAWEDSLPWDDSLAWQVRLAWQDRPVAPAAAPAPESPLVDTAPSADATIPGGRSAAGDASSFSARVRERFARRADRYGEQARLQRGLAWRLAHLCRDLPLQPGPCADLGAGTGLLSQALLRQRPNLPLHQVDLCPQLLARNPLVQAGGAALVWDLNHGLPAPLAPASLLVSSFALQWLENPALELRHWIRQLRPGGWLALALPTAGSLHIWQQAAREAAVPCTALSLPRAEPLLAVASAGLELRRSQILRFSSNAQDGRQALGRIAALGASASRGPRLAPGQLRRLLAHWPQRPAWCWEVLLLLGRRR